MSARPPVIPSAPVAQSETYSYGVPKQFVWFVHVVMGLFFVYLGYEMITKYKELPNFYNYGLILLVVGSVMALYHSWLWLSYASRPVEVKVEGFSCGCT
jgi:hypothetical protein